LLAAFKRITEQRESRKSEVAPRQRAHELLPSPSGVERQDGLQADDLLLKRERNPGSALGNHAPRNNPLTVVAMEEKK
jgi:hypothetical protein